MTKPTPTQKTLNLKRTVTIKAIVTEKFKEYMRYEIQRSIYNLQTQGESPQTKERLEEAHLQLEAIDLLALGSQFVQGVVDGFVTVSEGDNLYDKLGGMEVIVLDGIVKKIATAPKE